jgi:putative salt-induced outer membrane protein
MISLFSYENPVLTELMRAWTKTFSTKYWVEFLPNLSDSAGYRLNTELSGNAALSEIFSIKLGYLIRYNNTPPAGAAKQTDSTFTTALVAKF